MKRIDLIRYGLINLMIAGIASLNATGEESAAGSTNAAATVTPAAPVSTITVSTLPGGMPINILSGGQFEYFDKPIHELIKDERLLNSWRKAGVRVLRYPGGTGADHYIWNNPAAGHFNVGNAKTITTPAQFIEACRAIGAEPVFQVNTMSFDQTANRINPNNIEMLRKGAQRAAEWVRDANIKNRWNVKYWEIGNETWIWLKPGEHARLVVEYSKAMKAVDPSIKILAQGLAGKVGPFNVDSFFNFKQSDPSWEPRTAVMNEPGAWNDALFTIAKGHFDYIASHPYIGTDTNLDTRNMYLETVKKVWKADGLNCLYDELRKYAPTGVKIAITEWSCNFLTSFPCAGGKKVPAKCYYYMLGNGINMAHYFGMILENPNNEIASVHSISDLQTLWYWPKHELFKDEPLQHAGLLGLSIWSNNLGTRRMTVKSSRIPALTIGETRVPAVYFFASEDDSYRYLVAINLDPENGVNMIWNTAGNAAATVSMLSGKSLDTQNFDDWGKSKKAVEIETSAVMPVNGAYALYLPKHSMAGVKVKK